MDELAATYHPLGSAQQAFFDHQQVSFLNRTCELLAIGQRVIVQLMCPVPQEEASDER